LEQKKAALTNPSADNDNGQSEPEPAPAEPENHDHHEFEPIIDPQQAEVEKVKDNMQLFIMVKLWPSF